MGLFGSMNTAVSGMHAQTNRLSAVSENIANSDTDGYKRANVKFSSFLLPSTKGTLNSGGVTSNIGHDITMQGDLANTSSGSDVAITGKGFFVVQDDHGRMALTRAGSFKIDQDGYLVNAAGYTLLGTKATGGSAAAVNGLNAMEPINLSATAARAKATSNIGLMGGLDARKPVIDPADLPSVNATGAKYSFKTSVTSYDSLGRETVYDVYFSKTTAASNGANPTPDTWEATVYRHDEADPVSGGFPYKAAGGGTQSVNQNTMPLTFDSNGQLTNATTALSFVDGKTVPQQTVNLDFKGFTQLAKDSSIDKLSNDGQRATVISDVKIDKDGTVYGIYSDSSKVALYRIQLADVSSPDNLEPASGNIFHETPTSGAIFTGYPGEGSFGETAAGQLERSNVDMANELTDMIQAQRSYTANSKVFQTGSELMDILVNLKR